MTLVLQRIWYTDKSTCGELLIDGQMFCYTMEPRKDQSKGKPYAIPAGTYTVVLQPSPHFQMTTPHLLNVPGFEAIEIHPGNYPEDTHGCILVGAEHQEDLITGSRDTFNKLMAQLTTLEAIEIRG